MTMQTCKRDEFGPTVFNVNGILEKIPRAYTTDYKHIDLKSLVLNNIENDTYVVYPNSDVQGVSRNEANIIIQKYIWNNFFNLSKNYKYHENSHYPTTFRLYMKTKLGLDLQNAEDLDNFIDLVRNALFVRTIYLFKPYFIQITNELIDNSPIRIQNESVYEIKPIWKYWL